MRGCVDCLVPLAGSHLGRARVARARSRFPMSCCSPRGRYPFVVVRSPFSNSRRCRRPAGLDPRSPSPLPSRPRAGGDSARATARREAFIQLENQARVNCGPHFATAREMMRARLSLTPSARMPSYITRAASSDEMRYRSAEVGCTPQR